MTSLRPLPLMAERTDWRGWPGPVRQFEATPMPGGRAPAIEREHLGWVVFGSAEGDLLCRAWLDAFTAHITTVPITVSVNSVPMPKACVADGCPPMAAAPLVIGTATNVTPAQRLAAELRAASGLTNEEIAPLVGVSRRSLQAWIAGEAISARNESRLRAVFATVHALAGSTASATRERLLGRSTPQMVRAYDLIAEQRYDAAIDLALGRRSEIAGARVPDVEPLDVQLGRIEESIASPAPRVNRQMSRPLRR